MLNDAGLQCPGSAGEGTNFVCVTDSLPGLFCWPYYLWACDFALNHNCVWYEHILLKFPALPCRGGGRESPAESPAGSPLSQALPAISNPVLLPQFNLYLDIPEWKGILMKTIISCIGLMQYPNLAECRG